MVTSDIILDEQNLLLTYNDKHTEKLTSVVIGWLINGLIPLNFRMLCKYAP